MLFLILYGVVSEAAEGDAAIVEMDAAALTFSVIQGNNTDPNSITKDLKLPIAGTNGSQIWS